MEFLGELSAKDVLTGIVGLSMAWMFIKMSIKSLDARVTKVEEDNEIIRNNQNALDKQLAVILEQTKNSNQKIDNLTSYVHSKI